MGRSCPICGSREILEDELSGEIVCRRCGYVLDSIPSPEPEWRAYSYSDRLRRERAGPPLTPMIHDLGLSTKTPKRFIHHGRGLDGEMIEMLSEIHGISSRLKLSRAVEETAALLYRKAVKKEILPGRGLRKTVPAALLYLSSRLHGLPRMLREFAAASGMEDHLILRCYMRLLAGLGIKIGGNGDTYITRLVKALALNGAVERVARLLLEQAERAGLTQGRSPRIMAAAAIYVSSKIVGVRLSQRRLAKELGVGLANLRTRCREIMNMIKDLDMLDDYIRGLRENRY